MVAANMPQSGIQKRVRRITDLSKELREFLDETPILRSYQQYCDDSTAIAIASSLSGHAEACDFFEAVQETYTCACAGAHTIGLGCYCAGCSRPFPEPLVLHSTAQWAFCLAFPASRETLPGHAATVFLEPVPDSGINGSAIQDLCSLVQKAATGSELHQVLVHRANHSRMYRMRRKKIDSGDSKPPRIKYLSDLRQAGNGLSTKDRLELALRLSLAIVQLCKTPWVSETWTWNDVCVSQATAEDDEHHETNFKRSKFPVMFILREMYSATDDGDGDSVRTAVEVPGLSPFLDRDKEPVLTKLGIALIELACARSIQEMRRDYGMDTVGGDSDDAANILTAKWLLRDRRIRNEATVAYEGVVSACMDSQFIGSDGSVRRLSLEHESFLSSSMSAILMPLFKMWKQYDI